MIDTTVDPGYAALEREEAMRKARAQYAERKAQQRQGGGRLAVTPRRAAPAAPAGELKVETPETAATVAVPPKRPADPEAPLTHLRIARFSLAVVVVLVLFAVWVRQKRA